MKIQFIYPPAHVNPASLTALRPAAPLGLAYIMAVVRKAGHEVVFLDALAEAPEQYTAEGPLRRIGLSNRQIADRIDSGAGVICISNMWTYAWPFIREMICEIKKNHPEKIIICGGEHFTGLAELSMQQAPIDYIVQGEGEDIIVQLLEKMNSEIIFKPQNIPGLVWRKDDDIMVNSRADRIKEIDRIEWPAWDLVKLDIYDRYSFVNGASFGKTIPILATRGCPYQCTYCASPKMWTTEWYARSYIDVVDEIEHYVRLYQATNFPFHDLTMILKKQWIMDFSREIINRKLDITWQLPTGTRCEVIDHDVAPLLLQSGCKTICYAPETGSEGLRHTIKKMMKTEKLMDSVKATVDAKLTLAVFFVIGFPEDTRQDLRETVKMVRKLGRMGASDVACPFYFPIPATEMYDKLLKINHVGMDDDSLMAPMFCHYLVMTDEHNYCEHVSSWELTFYKYWIVANFYFSQWFWHPSRLIKTIRNVFLGKEESKMDTFLNEKKRELLSKLFFFRKPAVSGNHS